MRTEKIRAGKNWVICSVSDALCPKQIKRNCHNPIFTPGIFSGIGMQNEVTRLSRVWSKSSSNASRSSQKMAEGTFREVWKDLTDVDQVWPSWTEVWPRQWPGQNQDWIDHFLTIAKSTSRPLIRHLTGQKRTRNKEIMGKTVKIDPMLN